MSGYWADTLSDYVGLTMPNDMTCPVCKTSANMLVDSFGHTEKIQSITEHHTVIAEFCVTKLQNGIVYTNININTFFLKRMIVISVGVMTE